MVMVLYFQQVAAGKFIASASNELYVFWIDA